MTMQISWWTLAIQGLNFLVLVWLLRRFLYRPVQEIVERRQRLERDTAAAAEQVKTEADALKRRYDQALAGIANERRTALDRAHDEIEAERKKILEDASRSAAASIENAKKEIASERDEALGLLRKDVVDLAGDMAARLLADIAPGIPSDTVLARLEAGIAAMEPAERQRLDREIAANETEVAVVTANSLGVDERAAWKARLEHLLEHPLHITFTEDADLIGGAEMRLPHTVIRASWSDQLKRVRAALQRGGHVGQS